MIQYVDKQTGEIYSTRYERFYIVDLALTSTNLNECLKEHFKTEIMSEENNNAYYSDKYEEHNSHFVSALIKKIYEAEDKITLWGTGKPLRQFMYGGDLARVIKYILEFFEQYPIVLYSF